MKISEAGLVVALLITPSCNAFLASRNERRGNHRGAQQPSLQMVLETPPELAEYRKNKLGESSSIDPDHVIDEARKRRRAIETTAKLEDEKALNKSLQSTLSPEVAEYLQTKLGTVATIRQEAIQIQTDLSKIQSQSDETLLSDVNSKVEFLAKKAEELTQRVQALKKTSLTQDSPATPPVASSSLPVQTPETTAPLSTALTVSVESSEAQLALARQARLRHENAMQQRDEALRNQAESRRLAWEESKKRAEEKARRKRVEPVVAKAAPKPPKKLDILARFEAWKDARDKSEDMKQTDKGDVPGPANVKDKGTKTPVSERRALAATIPELDVATKARYEAWKRSKLEEPKKGTVNGQSMSGQQSKPVDTSSSGTTFPSSRPVASTGDARNRPDDVASSASSPPGSPRFDPRTRSMPKDTPTIMVKAVRSDDRFSSGSSTAPFDSPSDLPVETPSMSFERPSLIAETWSFPVERPFFLEKPDGVFFLEIGEAAQMLHSVEAEMQYEPQSTLYNGRMGTSQSLSAGPTQATSGSWLGNLWRRLNRPDPSLPPDFVVRSPSPKSQGKANGNASRIPSRGKDWNPSSRAKNVTPSVPLEYAVRPTRPSQRIVSQPPPVAIPTVQVPRTQRRQVSNDRSASLEPPEFAVRPTRIQPSNTGGNSRRDQRSTISPLEESPEFSVRGTPSKGRDTPDFKPPYYARW